MREFCQYKISSNIKYANSIYISIINMKEDWQEYHLHRTHNRRSVLRSTCPQISGT